MQQELNQEDAGKKGLSGWAWAGIGCGTIVLIGVIAFALLVGFCKRKIDEFGKEMQSNPERKAAEMIIGIHPDYSVVSANDETRQMTIREDKTGKETTFSYRDIADGKFAVTSSDGAELNTGSFDLAALPSWVELPTDAHARSGYQSQNSGKTSGVVVITTALPAQDVQKHFEKSWKSWTKYTGSSNSMTMNAVETINMERKSADKSITVVIQSSAGVTTVTVTYSEK
ncbi:MAG: hypothetical protein RI957_139 [Verrucomicrobiota bacterium]|jgi:hypothetical protein